MNLSSADIKRYFRNSLDLTVTPGCKQFSIVPCAGFLTGGLRLGAILCETTAVSQARGSSAVALEFVRRGGCSHRGCISAMFTFRR